MSQQLPQPLNVSIEDHHAFIVECLRHVGTSEQHALIVADALALTDSWGTFTHGSKLLNGYTSRVKHGGCRSNVDPEIVRDGPSWAIVDGHSTLGQVAATFAMKTAIGKAKEAGMAYVGVHNSCHFGAAGVYSAMAADENMIGISTANDIPSVAAPGSRKAVLGTNPFSYAVPARKYPPILLDMAMSTVAGGKVYAAHQLGKEIPDNWIIDADGQPTTDGSLYPENAALAPMSGHKGYGLALLMESLAGVLSGANLTWNVKAWISDNPSEPTHHGAGFLAFNIGVMQDINDFLDRVDGLIDEIHSAPKIKGVDRLYVPGEMEWERREVARGNGITLPSDVVLSLKQMTQKIGLETTIM